MIYRIDQDLARQQAGWFVVGIALFVATVLLLRDVRVLERYRYVIAAIGIGLLVAAAAAGNRGAGERRLPRRRPRADRVSADGVREALHRRLPRQLSGRAGRRAGGWARGACSG